MSGPFDDLEPDRPATHGAEPAPVSATEEHAATPGPARPEPRPGEGAVRHREPPAIVAFVRGVTKRCPRCGSGGLFVSWFKIRQRCSRCGLRLEREEGGFLGAMVLSYVVTVAVWLGLLIAWLIVDLPDLDVGALTLASIAAAGLVPLLFWPFSKTIWASVDYLVYRASPDYLSREAADRSGGNGGRP